MTGKLTPSGVIKIIDKLNNFVLTNPSSANAVSNNPSSENVSSENVSSENVVSNNPSSMNPSSENVSSENVSSENVSSENVSSVNVSSVNVSSENTVSNNPSSLDQKVNYVVDSKQYLLTDEKVIQDLLYDWELSKDKNIYLKVEGESLGVDRKINIYDITFTKEEKKIQPEIKVIDGTLECTLPDSLKGHSYPKCSCPSNEFGTSTSLPGSCKHIEKIFLAMGLPVYDIDWPEIKNA